MSLTSKVKAASPLARTPDAKAAVASAEGIELYRARAAKGLEGILDPSRGLRLRTAVTFAVWAFILYLLVRFSRGTLRYFQFDPQTLGPHFWPRRGWLLLHVVGGLTALFLGPSQFWPWLRRRALNLHRWMGRLYLMGVASAGTSALYLAFFEPPENGGWVLGVSVFTLGVVWLAASAMALLAILNGRVQTHKEWMIRSYVLTFSFINFRWWLGSPFIANLGTRPERAVTVVWLGWTVPFIITEFVLQWRHVRSVPGADGWADSRFSGGPEWRDAGRFPSS